MAQTCPISNRSVDSNIVRIISFQVALFALILLITQEMIFALILLFDFTLRALRLVQYSPFHFIGHFILSGLGFVPRLCDEAPKKFALYLGLISSFSIVILFVAEHTVFATFIATTLLLCALLETLFEYCIGCKLYYAIQIAKGFFNHDGNLH